MSLLRVSGLVKRFGGLVATDGVDLRETSFYDPIRVKEFLRK